MPNAAASAIASAVQTYLQPAGTVIDFAGSSVPSGWLECDGTAVSRSTYATLYSAVGDTWGAGNGTTTFNLPDFRGRVRIGKGTGSGLTARSLAATGGEETHVLTEAELASHTHTQDSHVHQETGVDSAATTQHAMTYKSGSGGVTGNTLVETNFSFAASAVALNTQSATATNQDAGSDTAHNTMQPFAVTMTIIKY
jgi:microcystin-dependent protein